MGNNACFGRRSLLTVENRTGDYEPGSLGLCCGSVASGEVQVILTSLVATNSYALDSILN